MYQLGAVDTFIIHRPISSPLSLCLMYMYNKVYINWTMNGYIFLAPLHYLQYGAIKKTNYITLFFSWLQFLNLLDSKVKFVSHIVKQILFRFFLYNFGLFHWFLRYCTIHCFSLLCSFLIKASTKIRLTEKLESFGRDFFLIFWYCIVALFIQFCSNKHSSYNLRHSLKAHKRTLKLQILCKLINRETIGLIHLYNQLPPAFNYLTLGMFLC